MPVTFAGSSVFGLAERDVGGRRAGQARVGGVDERRVRQRVGDRGALDRELSLAPLTVTVEMNARASVLAPTVVSHGTEAGEPTVPAPGPLLPAELATKTPASEAPRKA